jgi:hypothetical protein
MNMKLQFTTFTFFLLHCGGAPFDSSQSTTTDPSDASSTTLDESSIQNNPMIDASFDALPDASPKEHIEASNISDANTNSIKLCCATTANGLDDNCMSREPPSPLQPLPCGEGVTCAKELGMNCAQVISASVECPGYTVECE